jgi:CheY-like chemotaxis protein
MNHVELAILLVDDDPDRCCDVSDILRDRGYHVDTAQKRHAALRLVERQVYNLALLDLRMPGRGGRPLAGFNFRGIGSTGSKTNRALLLAAQAEAGHVKLLRGGLAFLSNFTVEVRYPGDNATKRQAASAGRWAGKVRYTCRHLLGLQQPPADASISPKSDRKQ